MTTKSVVNVIQQSKAELLKVVEKDPSSVEPVLSKLVDAYMRESSGGRREELFEKLSHLIRNSLNVASITVSKAAYAGINDPTNKIVLGAIAVASHRLVAIELTSNSPRDIGKIKPRKSYETIQDIAIRKIFHP
ncbi:MAG TPA: hypothetical protein VND15_03115 [Candidatus Acidoferrales bacterium]|nr:hypothetical protein [Candidatus Acidoferrales bacterium]